MGKEVFVVTNSDGNVTGYHESSGGAIQEVRDTVSDDHYHNTGITHTYNEETGGVHSEGSEGSMDIVSVDVKP